MINALVSSLMFSIRVFIISSLGYFLHDNDKSKRIIGRLLALVDE